MNDIPAPVARVRDASHGFGLEIELRVMDVSARTAEEAASACGCAVGAIVKSLVFRGLTSGKPILLLVSGANRVDEAKVAETIGEAIERPDAAFVRQATGFAIGGIPPFAHATALSSYFDRDLLAHDRVWAAAGTPHAVFAVDPEALRSVIGAPVIVMG
jgi:prolyl-tRNA editing enzyme YbaK/EbsC (Cys-tRNA(Pro) deacylase)